MHKPGDFVTISGYYIADCPHHIDTKTFYPVGGKFGPCPACPEPRHDDLEVRWTLVGTEMQDFQ